MVRKTAFFIDGFNVYHFLKRLGSGYLWLNYMDLAKTLAPSDEIVSVNYFSALAGWNNDKVVRHRLYAKALQSVGVNVNWGNFADKDKIGLVDSEHNFLPVRFFGRKFTAYRQKIYTHEEKETDVAIGVRLYKLASKGNIDKIALLSNDTDMAPALEEIRADFPHVELRVYAPVPPNSTLPSRIRGIVGKKRQKYLNRTALSKCQFPDPVVLPDNTRLSKPVGW